MEPNFQTIELPGADGTTIQRKAWRLPAAGGVLAVQSFDTFEGGCYVVLHVPSGGVLSRYGFSDPVECQSCILKFWERLDARQRYKLSLRDGGQLEGAKDLMDLFIREVVSEADIKIIDAGTDQ